MIIFMTALTYINLSYKQPVIAISSQSKNVETEQSDECGKDGCVRSELFDENTPHIITPRRSYILEEFPILSWYGVKGANQYSVTVQGVDSGSTWQFSTTQTSVEYTGAVLIPEQRYIIKVTSDKNIKVGESSFQLLEASRASELMMEINSILTSAQEEVDKYLQASRVYSEEGVYTEAINILESYINDVEGDPKLYNELVDLYREIGLQERAYYYEEIKNETLEPASN